jgi:hypothetical protein
VVLVVVVVVAQEPHLQSSHLQSEQVQSKLVLLVVVRVSYWVEDMRIDVENNLHTTVGALGGVFGLKSRITRQNRHTIAEGPLAAVEKLREVQI